MFKEVIIDADSIVYRCGFAAEGESLENALHNVKTTLNHILAVVGCGSHRIFIKGEGNFRDAISVSRSYKATRASRKPEHYDQIRKYLNVVWGAEYVDGMEADDRCSVELMKSLGDSIPSVLASVDKDLDNTPGWHYNYLKEELYYVSYSDSEYNFWTQMLTGDRIDNIPGLPDIPHSIRVALSLPMNKGVGKVTAKKLLERALLISDLPKVVSAAYLAWGRAVGMTDLETYCYFLEQGRLLWMTREMDGDKPVLFDYDEIAFFRSGEALLTEWIS